MAARGSQPSARTAEKLARYLATSPHPDVNVVERSEDALDADFVRRLDEFLALTDRFGIHVLLDNHGDMVGTAGCGNGVPMWIQVCSVQF